MNTNEKNQKIIGALVLLVVLAIGTFFFVRSRKPSAEAPESASTASSTSTTNADVASGTLGITSRPQVPIPTLSATGGYTVKEIPAGVSAPKAPDYSVPLVFSSALNLTAEQKAAVEAQAAALRVQLAKDPSSYVAWLALGRTFKMAGDYAQAAKIWTYLSLNWPADAISLGNLGDLYMNFIKDYPKADASYQGAIRRDFRQVNAYRNLFQLYSGLYTTRATAAEDTLKEGIQNNPDAVDLYILLAQYYRDTGRMAEARAEYDRAIAQAKKQSNSEALVADLISEQAALK